MADMLAMRSGTMTLAQAISRQGHNPDAVLAEIAAMNAKIDALGLKPQALEKLLRENARKLYKLP